MCIFLIHKCKLGKTVNRVCCFRLRNHRIYNRCTCSRGSRRYPCPNTCSALNGRNKSSGCNITRCSSGSLCQTLSACDLANSRNHIIRKCGRTNIWNALRTAHCIYLKGKNAVLLFHQRKNLLIQTSNLFIQGGIICLICLQLMTQYHMTHQNYDQKDRDY